MNAPRLLGKDSLCPCRSGKSFEECCLREGRATYEQGIPVIQMAGPPPELVERFRQDRLREARFGLGRPAIHVDWQGQKRVAVGRELLSSAHWKTPIDFLSSYLIHVMTPAWFKDELAKPLADQHFVTRWYEAKRRLQATMKQPAGPGGIFSVEPSGAMRAYLLLAFDLYTLQHNSALESRLLERLRHREQYQGARHELFSAATCIRAGFDIKYEDESDGTCKHTEFIATNLSTGASICVEAKSKHRSGVLGMAGEREPDDEVRTRLGQLINSALKKPHPHPLVIFLDLNLPSVSPVPVTPEWFKSFGDPVVRQICRNYEEDPWDLLVFSNQPDHYATDDSPAPGGYSVAMFGKNSRIGQQPPPELVALFDAANKFGMLPNTFEEM